MSKPPATKRQALDMDTEEMVHVIGDAGGLLAMHEGDRAKTLHELLPVYEKKFGRQGLEEVMDYVVWGAKRRARMDRLRLALANETARKYPTPAEPERVWVLEMQRTSVHKCVVAVFTSEAALDAFAAMNDRSAWDNNGYVRPTDDFFLPFFLKRSTALNQTVEGAQGFGVPIYGAHYEAKKAEWQAARQLQQLQKTRA